MKSLLTKILVGFVFIVLAANSNQAFTGLNFNYEPNESVAFEQGWGVSRAAYRRMKIGMSFRQCNNIIGFEGEIMTRNYGGGKEFISVKWEGDDYAIITAVFRDRILTNKYEANLR